MSILAQRQHRVGPNCAPSGEGGASGDENQQQRNYGEREGVGSFHLIQLR